MVGKAALAVGAVFTPSRKLSSLSVLRREAGQNLEETAALGDEANKEMEKPKNLFDKYHSSYFGKVGMRYFHKLRNKFHCLIVNIDKLWSLVPQEAKDKATKDNVPLIDVTQFRYFKVMGKGVLPENQPVVVKVKLVSKTAEKKIKEAGGAVVLTA
nr:60S ribosomal protein L27a-3-like [Coffea arabica]